MQDKTLSESKKARIFLCILVAMLSCTLAMIHAEASDRVLRYPFDVLRLSVLVYFGAQGSVDVAAVMKNWRRQPPPDPAPPSEPST